jgi:hypothetical protein
MVEKRVSCAAAYDLRQRLSTASTAVGSVTEDDVSKAMSDMQEAEEKDCQSRQYSAFEVDIGTVLTSLKHGS